MEDLSKFDIEVADRTVRRVCPEDLDRIQNIATSLASETQQAGWGDGFKVTEVPGVMCRVHLLEGNGVHARWHLFREANAASETNVHSHGSAFVSCSLAGQYKHKLWQPAEQCSQEKHYRFPRSGGDGSLGAPDVKPGQLVVSAVHMHHPGLAYYIHEDAHHSVDAICAPILSLWLKGADRKLHPTSVLSSSPHPQEVGGALAAEDRELLGDEKRAVLQEVACLCAGARPPDPKEEYLVYLKCDSGSPWALRCLLCDKWVTKGREDEHGDEPIKASKKHASALRNYVHAQHQWFYEHIVPRKARLAHPLFEEVQDGWTDLLWAAYGGDSAEVSRLLKLGADPEQQPAAQSFEGTQAKTSLFYAIDAARDGRGHGVESARLLLEAGANPHSEKCKPCMSALAYAKERGPVELTEMFDYFSMGKPADQCNPAGFCL